MSQAYENITAYDVPQVLAGQLVQGRLTPSNIKRTFLDPDSLSPRDRRELSSVIADKTGMGGLPEGVIDFATNPFILMLALTRSPGASALRQGSLQAVKEGKSAYSTVYRPWLHRWLLGISEATKGTELNTVFSRFAQRMETFGNYVHGEMAGGEAMMVEKLNALIQQRTGKAGKLKSLDFKGLRRNSEEYKELRLFNTLLAARSSKEHQVYLQEVLKGQPQYYVRNKRADGSWAKWRKWEGHKVGGVTPDPGELKGQFDQLQRGYIQEFEENGVRHQLWHRQPKITSETTAREARIDPTKLEAMWKTYGTEGDDFLRVSADMRRWTWWKTLGDEGHLRTWDENGVPKMSVRDDTGEVIPFVFDERKLWRFAKRIANENQHLGAEARTIKDMESRELLEAIVGPDQVDVVLREFGPQGPKHARTEKWWREHAKPQLEQVLLPQDWASNSWMPRNVVDVVGFHDAAGRRVVPRIHKSQLRSSMEDLTAAGSVDAIAGGVVGRMMPRRHADLEVHWEDLAFLDQAAPGGILTASGSKHITDQQRRARAQHSTTSPERAGVLEAYRLDFLTGHRLYLDQMIQAAAANSPIDMGIVAAESLHKRHWDKQRATQGGTLRGPGDTVESIWNDHEMAMARFGDEAKAEHYMNGFSLWDQIERGVSRHDPSWAPFLRGTAVPTAIHRQRTPAFLAYANSQLAKARAARLSDPNTAMGKFLRSTPAGESLANHLYDYAQTPGLVRSLNPATGLARYMYVTHLGANLSSVMLNLTQPLLMAAAVGDVGIVGKAYGQSMKEMNTYIQKRLAFGPRSFIKGISETDKERIIKESFSLTQLGPSGEKLNVVGITPDFHKVIDEMVATSIRKKGVVPRTEELLMAGFEKSEWFNRNVAAHIAKGLHEKHGVPGDMSTLQSDIEWLVNLTQFGASPTNRPGFLREGPLSNSLLKVFLTFPTRMATSTLSTFPAMEGNSLLNNTIRGMGISAVIHELSKNFLDVDISRGLFFDASTDIFGFERMIGGDDPISAKVAAINLPVSVLRGIATGDQQELANAFSRMLPAGVAASRVISVLPDARGTIMDPAGHLQKTYVDWGDPIVGQDGRTLYPTFTHEGRLIEYRSGPELVVKGLGVDLGTWGEQGQLDHYLVKQGAEMKGMRAEALRRLKIGDISGYTQLKNEFEERFSDPKTGARIPFTITQDQIRAAVNSNVRGRSERILNSLPSDYRPIYQQMVTSSGYARNVAREALLQEKTARARDPWRYTGNAGRDEQLRMLEDRLASLTAKPTAFGSF